MDFEEVYGLESASTPEPDPVPPPNPAARESTPAPQAAKGAVAQSEQLPALSRTAQATARINQIRAERGRPITSAIGGSSGGADSSGGAAKKSDKKRGFFASLIAAGDADEDRPRGGPTSKGAAAQNNRDDDDKGLDDRDEDAGADRAANKSATKSLLGTRHLIIGGVGIAVALVVAMALVIGILSSSSGDRQVASTTGGDGATTTPAAPSARDKPLPIEVDESEAGRPMCPAPSSDVANAYSPDKSKALTCTRAWNADGAQFTFNLAGGPYVITEVRLKPGFDYTDPDTKIDQWALYRIVRMARWQFEVGKPVDQTFNASRKQQSKRVEGVISSKVTLRITKTVPPSPDAPAATSTGPTFGFPGGFGSINLPDGSSPAGKGTNGQPSGALTAFALSQVQIIGHRA
ncbi:hypothetical protein [Mycobacteroides salmoniphilum]|uniref:Uncharacterized protein n=1 Tax=Mycobacteroides salmoniphilum TaxID=404941 RepID=A0A4R8T016_9MYCO|nr:hypothetical protein [Mycobacteroides salmoniphilum]TEA09225.1 hypothetical protein CCUG60884_00215 [Mycobacteroides salmoniphilum]